jgi:hypothetical protein
LWSFKNFLQYEWIHCKFCVVFRFLFRHLHEYLWILLGIFKKMVYLNWINFSHLFRNCWPHFWQHYIWETSISRSIFKKNHRQLRIFMSLGWMDGLRRVEPLLIEAELLHAGLCLGLMCFPKWKVKRVKTKRKLIEES